MPSPILLAGQWRPARSESTFRPDNPATGEKLTAEYPKSTWQDCDDALSAATEAATALRSIAPPQLAKFLTRFADRLDARKSDLVEIAHQETALAKTPRLADVELPRTTNQLRQAAAAAIEGSWALPTIDTKLNIRSMLAPIGPVVIFGPNNFPFAYNPVAGGDFASTIAVGNPVIAKAHPSHPGTSRLLAEEAFAALTETGLPPATVQMLYDIAPQDGLRLVSDSRTGAAGFTGSRRGGLALKAAADKAGKPIYLELSSLNPVVILPGALKERPIKIADEFADSALAASGQFCTNPGLVLLIESSETNQFIADVRSRFESRPVAPLLASAVAAGLETNVRLLIESGAMPMTGAHPLPDLPNRFANTLLRVDGDRFLAEPEKLQTEAFGNASLFVIARDELQLLAILHRLEGNLTASLYTDTTGKDDTPYNRLAPTLRAKVGRLLNDKMPTGVAVTSAMNHGGPYPSTGHPAFTAVGIPASLRRFTMLQCFDNVRPNRLPALLANKNMTEKTWRLIDNAWSQDDVS